MMMQKPRAAPQNEQKSVESLQPEQAGATEQGVEASPTPTGTMSLHELIGSKTAQKCTFVSTADSVRSSGTILVGGGKMRGDFTSVVQGKTIRSYLIVRDGASYVWSDAMPQGVKMSLATAEKPRTNSVASEQAVDFNRKTDYNCTPWTVDNSMFTLPAGITFTEMSALMQGTPTTGSVSAPNSPNTIRAAQCGACDKASASARTQCRTALGC